MIPQINVSVRTEFISETLLDNERSYQFYYEITIHNASELQVQLLSRHWWITNQFDKTIEVIGEGVVGKQPVIKPMQSFKYDSGAVIATPVGTMYGIYSMRTELGKRFEVEVPQFVLASKKHLH